MISEQPIFTCISQVDDGQRDPRDRGVTTVFENMENIILVFFLKLFLLFEFSVFYVLLVILEHNKFKKL